jgi:hypothetical protein
MPERVARPCSLAGWQDVLETLSRSPYVGPRPQTSADEEMLVGRKDVLETIERKIKDSHLLVLHGDSGSGKTSLLQNGFREQLEGIGFEVFMCRAWPAMPDGADIDGYLLTQLNAQPGNPRLPTVEPADGIDEPALFASRL